MDQNGNGFKFEQSKLSYLKTKKQLFGQKRVSMHAHQSIREVKQKMTAKIRYKTNLSHSLNLNNAVLSNDEGTDHLVDLLDISKCNITLSNDQGLVQRGKQKINSKNKQKQLNQSFYYQIQQIKVNKKQQVKQKQRKRIQDFFKPIPQKDEQKQQKSIRNFFMPILHKDKQKSQSKSLTCSLILNTQTRIQKNDLDLFQQIQKGEIPKAQMQIKKCQNCQREQKSQLCFFKNELIQKHIKSIHQTKISTNQNQQVRNKHFPESDILSYKYFDEGHKRFINRINPNSLMSKYNKMKLFMSKKNSSKCSKCKPDERNSEKETSKPSVRPSNFQYFLYEYRTTGQSSTSKSEICSANRPTKMFSRCRNRQQKRSNQQQNIIELSSSSDLQGFIKHKKLQVPQRPLTAPFKNPAEIAHCKSINFRRVEPQKVGWQQNFVKPWESSTQDERYF